MDSIDVYMGTLSKTLASSGGYIAGDRGLIEYMRYLCPGLIFSVGLSPRRHRRGHGGAGYPGARTAPPQAACANAPSSSARWRARTA